MKKLTFFTVFFLMMILISSCTGYKPVFSSSKMQFEISNYLIEGNKQLGKEIYSKLYNLSRSKKSDANIQYVNIIIKVLKKKNATAKDSAGKILEYKINLDAKILVIDALSEEKILDQNFISAQSYKVQDQYSETIKLENKTLDTLINKIYQDFLIQLIANIHLQ